MLAIELFKVINSLGPTFMVDIFSSHPHLNSGNLSANMKTHPLFYNTDNPRTTNYGLDML